MVGMGGLMKRIESIHGSLMPRVLVGVLWGCVVRGVSRVVGCRAVVLGRINNTGNICREFRFRLMGVYGVLV